MKASDLFLKCLEVQGVKIIFGLPGEENADLMISLLKSPIEFITCRHEQTASFMADMHGRLTGTPGVCLATLGPGATNLLTGVANANMDHAPVIAIIGQADSHRLHKESHQNMDAVAMFQPVTKWSTTIRDANTIPEIISKAVKLACRPKEGAVLVELPEDIAKEEVAVSPMKPFHNAVRGSGDVEAVLEAIARAKKPLLLVGDGAIRANCALELRQFMDKTHMFAATTFMAKGAVDDRHPHSLHCVGLGFKDIAVKAFNESDLVICIGYSLYEWAPEKWRGNSKQKIIHMDYLPAEIDTFYDPDLELIGDIKHELQMLNAKLAKAHTKSPNYFAKIKKDLDEDLRRFDNDAQVPFHPAYVLHQVRTHLKDDDILVCDVGAHKMWTARQYMTYQPKTCFIYNGFCSMGGAIPGAVEAKRLYPQKKVMALCGDGGFVMSIQALLTAVNYNIPIVVMVWDDGGYGLIEWKQKMAYGKQSHVKLNNPDLHNLAAGFGANSIFVDDAKKLDTALTQAFKEKTKPTVIVLPMDYSQNMKLSAHLKKIT